MINLTPSETVHLRRIQTLLDAANAIFQENFDGSRQNEILEVHNEEASLPHALRWGCDAVEDLLEEVEPTDKEPTFFRKCWVFESISTDPFPEDMSLENNIDEAKFGSGSGKEFPLPSQKIGKKEADAALNDHDRPGFFDEPDEEVP